MHADLSQSTIAAIATPRGHGGVAIIRLSGADSWTIAARLLGKKVAGLEPGKVSHGWVKHPDKPHHPPVDEVLLLTFKGPKSYTGEDVAEIHCHGGDLLAQHILSLCLEQGAVAADPGAFTKRAFLNNKMDLTQAESVMDLIAARGERLMALATSNLKHRSLGQYIDTMAEKLMAIQAQIVAAIDFPDEVDEPDRTPLIKSLKALQTQADTLEKAAQHNRWVRQGLKIALLGMPNSGKSSIFNALLAQERSIVTDTAGTTRDVITETLQVNGVPVTLIDTAGLRESEDQVEILGIERSWDAATEAQGALYIYDASAGWQETDERLCAKLREQFGPTRIVTVANKRDLCTSSPKAASFFLSALSGEGVGQIFDWIETLVHQTGSDEDELNLSLNQRQLACLNRFRDNLVQAMDALHHPSTPIDLSTVPITDALRQLDELMGRDTGEEVLDRVFSQFCVGK